MSGSILNFRKKTLKKPTVSVVMAMRNIAPYATEAIRSVLEQKRVSFELLIADDASTDGTVDVVRSFGSDNRIRFWRFSKNKGASAARQFLIRRARGRYVAVCDGDDRLMPGALSRLSVALDSRPAVGVAYGDIWIYRENSKKKSRHRFPHPSDRWDLLWAHVWNGGSMIRRALLKEVGGYDPGLGCLEDYDLFLRLAECARFFRVKGSPVYWYRKRKGSLSSQTFFRKKKVFEKILRKAVWRRYRLRARW